jgi:hypothetical protein
LRKNRYKEANRRGRTPPEEQWRMVWRKWGVVICLVPTDANAALAENKEI